MGMSSFRPPEGTITTGYCAEPNRASCVSLPGYMILSRGDRWRFFRPSQAYKSIPVTPLMDPWSENRGVRTGKLTGWRWSRNCTQTPPISLNSARLDWTRAKRTVAALSIGCSRTNALHLQQCNSMGAFGELQKPTV